LSNYFYGAERDSEHATTAGPRLSGAERLMHATRYYGR